jgi:hypothetical protein
MARLQIKSWTESLSMDKDPSELYAWIDQNRLELPYRAPRSSGGGAAAAGQEPTHYSLNGFKLCVPAHMEPKFNQLYALELARGKDMYFVQLRKELFVFFFDADVVQPEEASLEWIGGLARTLQRTIREYYPPSTEPAAFRLVVLRADPKAAKGADGSPCVKTGLHIMLPGLVVTAEEALLLRAGCVAALRREHGGERPLPCNVWEDVLDECVYKGNGLRMVGSLKCSRCKCVAERRPTCKSCTAGKGFVREGRPYLPALVLRDGGAPDPDALARLHTDYMALVLECSIRTDATCSSPQLVPPPGAPMPLAAPSKRRQAALHAGGGGGERSEERDMRFQAGALTKVPSKFSGGGEIKEGTELFGLIEQCIRERVHAMYADVELARVLCDAGQTTYLCKLRACCRGGNWCMKEGRDHTSAQIYFQITRAGVSARCYSNKAPVDGRPKCSTWKSAPVRLPLELQHALFPGGGDASSSAASSTAGGGPSHTEAAAPAAEEEAAAAAKKAEAAAPVAAKAKPPQLEERHRILTHLTIKEVEAMDVFSLAEAIAKHKKEALRTGALLSAQVQLAPPQAAAGAAKRQKLR